MSGVSRFIAKVAGVVSIIATVVGIATLNPTLISIGQIAAMVGTAAGTHAIVTLKKPGGASP